MIWPLFVLLGLGLAYSRRGASAPATRAPTSKASAPKAPPLPSAAARIIRESREIIDGQRDAYTDPDAGTAAELALATAAAKLAQATEEDGAPPPDSPPIMGVQPSAATSPATPGVDLGLAKSTAPKVAAHLKKTGRSGYDRKVLRLWQGRAGITPDGIYGRGAAAALKYFTPTAPAAFFAQGAATYKPPAG